MPMLDTAGKRWRVYIGAGVAAVAVVLGYVLIEPGGGGPPPAPSPAPSCDRTATPSTFAAQVAEATAGQTLCLESGSYGTFTGTNKAITIRSKTGQDASLGVNFDANDNGFTLASLTITGCGGTCITNGAHDITFRDSKFVGPIMLRVQNSNIVFDHNTHVDIMAGALQGRLQAFPVGEDYKAPSGVTVRNSLFAGGDADGVQAHVGMTVINNEFRDICQGTNSAQHTDNVQMVFGATGFVFQHNFVHQTVPCYTQAVAAYDELDHATITDNVIQDDRRTWALELYSDDSSIVDHNTVLGDVNCNFYNNPCGYIDFTSKTVDDAGFGTRATNNIANKITIERATLAERSNNMVRLGPALPGDFVGVPVFVGGANPSTYEGYCLAPGSPGKGRAADGSDVGIRCTGLPPPTMTTKTTAPL